MGGMGGAHERLQDVCGLRGQRGAEKLKKEYLTLSSKLCLWTGSVPLQECLPVTNSGRSSRRDLQ